MSDVASLQDPASEQFYLFITNQHPYTEQSKIPDNEWLLRKVFLQMF